MMDKDIRTSLTLADIMFIPPSIPFAVFLLHFVLIVCDDKVRVSPPNYCFLDQSPVNKACPLCFYIYDLMIWFLLEHIWVSCQAVF